MADRSIITPVLLRQLLNYNPNTGKLHWKARGPEFAKSGYREAQGNANLWNAKWAGKLALDCQNPGGYRSGAVLNITLTAHKAAYIIHTGVMPSGEIDHINGVRDDNRAINLRDVAHAQNSKNAALYSSNTSGTPGVMWEQSHKAWAAKINIAGKQRRIGRYKSKEDAVAARKAAEVEHGYHPNHGRAASR